jgi:formate hydrogenlyase subunit 4
VLAFASFAEPALYAGFLALVLATGQTSLGGVLGAPLAAAWSRATAPIVMVAVTWFVVMLVEAGRVPVDDPATHLELTMIHEVIVLDHSGPDLALLLYGSALKFALFAALVVSVLVPRAGLPAWAALAVLLAGMLGVAALVGVLESVMARLRLSAVPQLLAAAAALSALGVILLLR